MLACALGVADWTHLALLRVVSCVSVALSLDLGVPGYLSHSYLYHARMVMWGGISWATVSVPQPSSLRAPAAPVKGEV